MIPPEILLEEGTITHTEYEKQVKELEISGVRGSFVVNSVDDFFDKIKKLKSDLSPWFFSFSFDGHIVTIDCLEMGNVFVSVYKNKDTEQDPIAEFEIKEGEKLPSNTFFGTTISKVIKGKKISFCSMALV